MRIIIAIALLVVACHKATPPELHPERASCIATVAQACKTPSGLCYDGIGAACAHCEPADPALNGCFVSVEDGPGQAMSTISLGQALWWVCYVDCSDCAPPRAGETCAPDVSP